MYTYTKMLHDVVVAVKPTPTRGKKLKAGSDLGVAPLHKAEQMNIPGPGFIKILK